MGVELRAGRLLLVKGRNARRLRCAFEELPRRRNAPWHLLRVLIGRITWVSLIPRQALSLLNASYAYISEMGGNGS